MPGGVTSVGNFVPGHGLAAGLYHDRRWRVKSGSGLWKYWGMGFRRSTTRYSPDKLRQHRARRKR